MNGFALRLLAATLSFGLTVTSSFAGTRSIWVSAQGSDATGCGALATPCKTLQYAHNTIAAAGQITVLGPADLGPLTITKAITIVAEGGGVARLIAGAGDAITVNAGPTDTVVLKGLDVDGVGKGTIGVLWNSGKNLTIENCEFRNFTGTGVFLQSGSNNTYFRMQDSVSSNNGQYGVLGYPPSGASLNASIVRSTTDGNGNSGFISDNLNGGTSTMFLTNISAFQNGIDINTYAQGVMYVSSSTFGFAEGSNGVIYTYHNNFGTMQNITATSPQ